MEIDRDCNTFAGTSGEGQGDGPSIENRVILLVRHKDIPLSRFSRSKQQIKGAPTVNLISNFSFRNIDS